MLPNLELTTWLSLTVVGTIVATLGSLLGILIRDYVFVRSFEKWKQRQTLEQLYHKFRDPLALSACELVSRIVEILDHYPPIYLREEVLKSRAEKQVINSIQDHYFQYYKFVSTKYRLSAFLAWIELYRQELTHLHSGNSQHAKKLELVVHQLRSDLADGQLNKASDWAEWKDNLLFREELRAIGESLIETRGTVRTVMGYGHYCEQLELSAPNTVQRWSFVVHNFFVELQANGKDFRQIRLKRLLVHLIELIRLLDGNSVEQYMEDASERHCKGVL